MKEKPVAIVTIRFGHRASPRGRKLIANWLRKEAKHLERCAGQYAPRVSLRYWLP